MQNIIVCEVEGKTRHIDVEASLRWAFEKFATKNEFENGVKVEEFKTLLQCLKLELSQEELSEAKIYLFPNPTRLLSFESFCFWWMN